MFSRIISRISEKITIATKTILWFIAVFSDTIAVGSMISEIIYDREEITLEFITIFVILLVILVLLCGISASYLRKLNLLSELAKHGHLHTMRMVLLVNHERKHECKILDVDRAEFEFDIGRSNKNRSSVIYNHTFHFRKKKKGWVESKVWIFGEGNIPPEGLEYSFLNRDWSCNTPELVGINGNAYNPNNGIYTFKWKFDDQFQDDPAELKLKYERKASFNWTQRHVFIIYPDSFMLGIKRVTFSVQMHEEDSNNISSIDVTEISGKRIARKYARIEKPVPVRDDIVVYKLGLEWQAHEESVYSITINMKNKK